MRRAYVDLIYEINEKTHMLQEAFGYIPLGFAYYHAYIFD